MSEMQIVEKVGVCGKKFSVVAMVPKIWFGGRFLSFGYQEIQQGTVERYVVLDEVGCPRWGELYKYQGGLEQETYWTNKNQIAIKLLQFAKANPPEPCKYSTAGWA